jgi:hypothetical protein
MKTEKANKKVYYYFKHLMNIVRDIKSMRTGKASGKNGEGDAHITFL